MERGFPRANTNFDILTQIPAEEFDINNLKNKVEAWTESSGAKPWNAWRVALVGAGKGPDMYELAAFLGREETLRRMQYALQNLC